MDAVREFPPPAQRRLQLQLAARYPARTAAAVRADARGDGVARTPPRHGAAPAGAELRRAFSGIVAGNVKEHGIRLIEEHGPSRSTATPTCCAARRAARRIRTPAPHEARRRLPALLPRRHLTASICDPVPDARARCRSFARRRPVTLMSEQKDVPTRRGPRGPTGCRTPPCAGCGSEPPPTAGRPTRPGWTGSGSSRGGPPASRDLQVALQRFQLQELGGQGAGRLRRHQVIHRGAIICVYLRRTT